MPQARPRPEDPVDHWKTRYLHSLNEIEQKERGWSEVERLLRRALGRMALAAVEAHPDLASELERLREADRENAESPRFAAIASDLADAALHAPAPRKGQGGTAMDALRAAGAVTPEDVLVEILHRLEPREAEGDTVAELLDRLGRPVLPVELPALVGAVADLVGRVRRGLEEEKRGLESFLSDVSERLAELGDNLSRSRLDRQASQAGRDTLHEQVKQEVARMRASVERARDVDALKEAVRSGLAAVETHVGEHLRVEGQRHAEAEDEARATSERLVRLVAETGRLRERLHRARQRAVRDPLTGLYNRLAYEERAAQAFAHWRRYGDPLSLLVLDVDHFKALNDRYGHAAGDRALKAISDVLAGALRESDFLARHGGEEFVALLPKTGRDAAANVAEKLRQAVEALQFQYRDQRVAVTVSCGGAEFRPGDTPASVFERADGALYRAKQAGRNRAELD